MNRRELVEALAAGVLWFRGAGQRPRRGASPARPPWTFRLSRTFRWSLVARDGRAVVSGAELATTLAGAEATTLAALEDARRFPLADLHGAHAGWQVVGTFSGVELTAQFLDGPPPLVTVTARGLAEPRRLDEVRFFDTETAEIPALSGRAMAWVNGYNSSDPCTVVRLEEAGALTSHWQLAVLPDAEAHQLALAFGVDDAGEGRFSRAGRAVVASSRFGGRPVGVQLPPRPPRSPSCLPPTLWARWRSSPPRRARCPPVPRSPPVGCSGPGPSGTARSPTSSPTSMRLSRRSAPAVP